MFVTDRLDSQPKDLDLLSQQPQAKPELYFCSSSRQTATDQNEDLPLLQQAFEM